MANLDYKYLAQLVIKAQSGDSNYFAELYAATYQQQYNFSYRYLKDEQLAQDALQETYIRALKSIHNLRDATLVVAWLNQINFRVCYALAYNNAKQQKELSDYDLIDLGLTENSTESPESEVIEVDSRRYIIRQVMNLPLTESQVIILRYYQEMKLDEIARAMNLSLSSVKRYLRSGKARLSKLLTEGGEVNV